MQHKIVFIHQNAPGQFRHLILHCASRPEYEVVVIGEKKRVLANFAKPPPGVTFHVYVVEDVPVDRVPLELGPTANAMRRGRAVALCLENLRRTGFIPDVVYGHPGWGEMLHVKDVFPQTRVAHYCEFYFNRDGQDLDFDPEFRSRRLDVYRVRTDNMTQLVSLAEADVCIAPTEWQRSRYPERFRSHINVVHDGIDVERVIPNEAVTFMLPDGSLTLDRGVPVITYVSRNLEPYRGFHTMMRALPDLLTALPTAHVLIVGGDEVSYGAYLAGGATYRQMMLKELEGRLDHRRIHFLGRVPYATYLKILQLSRAHIYLSYPFVLSWSMLEAMSAGAVVVGSRTAPVEEVITHEINGLLVNFFSIHELVEETVRACAGGPSIERIRQAARATVTQRFSLSSGCLDRQLDLLFPSQVTAMAAAV